MQVLRIIFSVFYSISSIIIIDHFPLLKFPFLLLCAIVLNRLLVNFSIICNYVLLTFVYTFKANDFSHGCAFSFSSLYHFPVQLPSLVLILKLHIPFQMINPLVMISDCILTASLALLDYFSEEPHFLHLSVHSLLFNDILIS